MQDCSIPYCSPRYVRGSLKIQYFSWQLLIRCVTLQYNCLVNSHAIVIANRLPHATAVNTVFVSVLILVFTGRLTTWWFSIMIITWNSHVPTRNFRWNWHSLILKHRHTQSIPGHFYQLRSREKFVHNWTLHRRTRVDFVWLKIILISFHSWNEIAKKWFDNLNCRTIISQIWGLTWSYDKRLMWYWSASSFGAYILITTRWAETWLAIKMFWMCFSWINSNH